jgi:hypothetical protein
MPDVFGVEGGGQAPPPEKKSQEPKGPPKPGQYPGEGPQGLYMQYDNYSGAMMLNLPARFAKYKRELQEDLMDEFYGSAAGGKDQQQTIDQWIAEWMRKKEQEDPSLIQPDHNE